MRPTAKNYPLKSVLMTALAMSFCLYHLPTLASGLDSQAQTPTVGCPGTESRQFDFWIGSWKVKNATGQEVGKSEISKVAEGCAIREQWTGGDGVTGTSLNYYDKRDGHWHQDWVGGHGLILHLTGGMEQNAMILSGDRESPQGRISDRISWTPLPNGQVLQEWKVSRDSGKSWTTSFSGYYVRQ